MGKFILLLFSRGILIGVLTLFTFQVAGATISVFSGTSQITNGQTVDFGSTPINVANTNVIFTVVNTGTGYLEITSITESSGYIFDTNFPAPVTDDSYFGPGTNGMFGVELDTNVPGIYTNDIVIACNDGDLPDGTFVMKVTETVVVASKEILLSGNLNFGVVPGGSASSLTLTIRNPGNVSLDVTNITYPPGFGISTNSLSVAPGGVQNVTVTFSPTAATNYGGMLKVYSDATSGATNIPVSGFGDGTNSPTFVLVVLTNGLGTVRPLDANTRTFRANQTITLTATAAQGNLFSNWAGSATTNRNPLTLVMDTNKIIEANFVTNLFISAKGQYNGVFWTTNDQIDEETAGMLKGLTVGTKGTYSGTLLINGAGHALGGTFNVAGLATNKITRPNAQGGNLLVELTLSTPFTSTNLIPYVTAIISGTNTNGVAWQSTNLTAELASNILAPASAEYTATIPPDTNSSNVIVPVGDGYALITNHNGTVHVAGALADGTPFSQSVPASQTGDVPVYASLLGNKGLLLGWINLETTNTNGPGTLYWVHPANVHGSFFTNFTTTNPINLSLWTNPSEPGANLTGNLPTNLTEIEFSAGVPPNTISFALTISNDFRLGGESPEALALGGSINPKTGLLTVTVGSGANKQTGYAVILLNETNGGGYFLTKSNAQAIKIGP